MKLWKCTGMASGWDAFKLMTGETREEVMDRWKTEVEDEMIYHLDVEEVNQVDGYEIKLSK